MTARSPAPSSRRDFRDNAACADYLARRRWPEGFVCPGCGVTKGWLLKTKAFTWECAACRRQTSVTAGTVMHGSHLPLKTWFTAIHIVTSHSNGISALQLQAQLGLGSYKSAWLLLTKLRRAMVDPERSLLEDVVEVDETEIALRHKDDPPAGGQGRSSQGKMLVAGAVELSPEGKPRRIRLAPIADFSGATLKPFVVAVAAAGARVVTDGWSGYNGLPDHVHEPKVVGKMAAHIILRWTHRVFSNLKNGRSGPTMASVASTSGVTSTSSSSGGTVAATQPWRSIPCSASEPASRQQPPATSSSSASESTRARRHTPECEIAVACPRCIQPSRAAAYVDQNCSELCMHQEAITRAAIRNINISQRRNEREKPLPSLSGPSISAC